MISLRSNPKLFFGPTLWLLTLFLLSSSLFAASIETESSGFDVEIILFQQVDASDEASTITPPYFNKARKLIVASPFSNSKEFSVLDPSHFQLNREYNALKRQKKYQVLLHLAWHQADKTKPIYLDSRAFLPETLAYNDQQTDKDAITGTIKVVKKRFFQLDSDLTLNKLCNQKSDASNRCYYPLTQQRNLKSDEVHYLDHPLFGMLVKITQAKA